ncbi:GNAT family N-acetyltransferase [Candidatus Binatia bacterium]|nr:GNAT family N-acetyltransferase [Candidatus Binatia bacterium]
MRFAVRTYQAGDEQQILALFNRVFQQERTPAHWHWKFADNPAGHQIVVAVGEDGRIIGQFAGLPAAAVSPTGAFLLSQGIDHMVAAEAQKQGVFAAMTRHFVDTFLPPARDVVFFSYPLAHKHSIDQRISSAAELVQPVRALRWDLARREPWRTDAGTWRTGRDRVRRVQRFPAGVDRFWERTVAPGVGVSIVRDRRYLNWRYAACPDVPYALLLAESRISGRSHGVAVLRFGWLAERIAPLCELLVPPDDRAVLALLLGACHDLAREHGLASVVTWAPPETTLYPALCELGYAEEETPFLLTTIADANAQRAAACRARWSYTMGDSDIY